MLLRCSYAIRKDMQCPSLPNVVLMLDTRTLRLGLEILKAEGAVDGGEKWVRDRDWRLCQKVFMENICVHMFYLLCR
jgi:hypothetical protein